MVLSTKTTAIKNSNLPALIMLVIFLTGMDGELSLQEKVVALNQEFLKSTEPCIQYYGCYTPKNLRLKIELPFDEIQAKFNKYGIIQLRRLPKDKPILFGCGNSTEYHSHFDSHLYTNFKQQKRFCQRIHGHDDFITVDKNIYMDPTLVASINDSGLMLFFMDECALFPGVYFEGYNPSRQDVRIMKQFLQSKSLVMRDNLFIIFTRSTDLRSRNCVLGAEYFRNLYNLAQEFAGDSQPKNNNFYYLEKAMPYLLLAHKFFLKHQNYIEQEGYSWFFSDDFSKFSGLMIHIIVESVDAISFEMELVGEKI